MKKIFLSAAVIFTASCSFAQKPVAGESGFSFGLSGIPGIHLSTAGTPTGTLGYRYILSEKSSLRSGVKYGYSKTTDKSDTTGNGIDTTKITTKYNWALSIGWQHGLGHSAKLEPYYGFDVFIDGQNSNISQKALAVSTTTPGAVVGDFSTLNRRGVNKGVGAGLRLCAGFNYFFADHFAFGAEFGYGLEYSKMTQGNATQIYQGNTFGPHGTTVFSNSSSSKSATMETNASGMITVSVFF